MTKQQFIIAGVVGVIFIGASLVGLALWSGGIGLKDEKGVHDSKYNALYSEAVQGGSWTGKDPFKNMTVLSNLSK